MFGGCVSSKVILFQSSRNMQLFRSPPASAWFNPAALCLEPEDQQELHLGGWAKWKETVWFSLFWKLQCLKTHPTEANPQRFPETFRRNKLNFLQVTFIGNQQHPPKNALRSTQKLLEKNYRRKSSCWSCSTSVSFARQIRITKSQSYESSSPADWTTRTPKRSSPQRTKEKRTRRKLFFFFFWWKSRVSVWIF